MTHYRYTEAELALPEHGAWVRRGNTRVWETSDETWSRNDGDPILAERIERDARKGTKPGENPGYDCGTTRAYRMHLRQDQAPCAACSASNAEDRRDRGAAKRTRAKARRGTGPSVSQIEAQRILADIQEKERAA